MNGGTPVLELTDVHASYGRFHALFGVSLSVAAGEAVAVVGRNGVGKTTLARVASGLVRPSSGRVASAGRDITGRDAHHFTRAGIVHENLALPFRYRFGARGLKAALQRAYDMFPRLGERRQQPAGLLSGGEQRMLTLARALVLEPRLLIADELSLGLAPIVTDEVYKVLGTILATGTALLVIEQHTQHALSIAHRAVVLERGSITFAGSCADAAALSTRELGLSIQETHSL
jgi:branched-chain amino acid transport system ATP-binding protein